MTTTNTNNMKITVKEKSVYGKILIYPVCDKASIFADLLNVKTFSQYQLITIGILGYEIEVIKLP